MYKGQQEQPDHRAMMDIKAPKVVKAIKVFVAIRDSKEIKEHKADRGIKVILALVFKGRQASQVHKAIMDIREHKVVRVFGVFVAIRDSKEIKEHKADKGSKVILVLVFKVQQV